MRILNCTLRQFAKTYMHKIAYCGEEWFEKQLGLLIPQVSYMATEMDDAFLDESILKKIPGMGPKRIDLLFDNADYFGYNVWKLEELV